MKDKNKLVEKNKGKNKKNKIGLIIKFSIIILVILLFLVFCCRNKGLTITLNVDNKEYHEITNIKKGDIVEEPKEPEKEGYIFAGWFLGNEKFDFEVPITEDISLTAKWTINQYEVTIKTGTGNIINEKVNHGETLSIPSTPSNFGYTFLGWYSNNEKFDFDTKITSDLVIEAKWAVAYSNYIVEHYLMDNEGKYSSKPIEKETFTERVGSYVTPSVKEYKGYTAPSTKTLRIIDGANAVVKYYYEINSYNLTIKGDEGIKEVTGEGTYFYNDKIEIGYTLLPGYSLVEFSEELVDNVYTMIDSDVEILITTKPNTDTKYVVKHCKMNLDGTYNNDECLIETLSGTTSIEVTPEVNTYTGFTSPKEETVTINGDGSTVVTYYYERNKYKLTLVVDNGIESTVGNGSYYFDEKVNVDATIKDGYAFAGWSNGAVIPKFSFTMGASDEEITANTNVIEYTITYIENGGKYIGNHPTKYNVETDTFKIDELERIGYTFVKWDGNNVTSDGTVTKGTTGDITIEAIFEVNTYEIVFNSNGGIGTMPNLLTAYDKGTTLTKNAFKKEGYTFVNWNTKSDGTGNGYSNEEVVSNLVSENGGSITLYALWKVNKYTVTYNSNGGTTPNSNLVTYDSTYGALPTVERVGYTFNGWYLNGEKIESATIVTTSSNHELVASWTANEYTVTYNSNGATTTPNSNLVTYDSTYGALPTAERVGYTFNGWYLNGTKIENTTKVTTAENHELVAKWTANKYTVTYNSNGATTTPNSNEVTYDNEYGALPIVERVGYTFAGWYLNGEKIESTTIVTTSSNHELVARWTANKYTVTYNSNGATTIPSSNEVTYDSEYGTLPVVDRLGYTFTGWYLNDTKIEDTTKVETAGNHELLAKWIANTYTIEFNANSGLGSMSNLLTAYGKDTTLTDNSFTKEGYTFVNWNTKSDGTGVSYSNEEVVNNLVSENGGSFTLYAVWEANKYTVTYNSNGGTTTPNSNLVTYDNEYGTLPKVERVGYTFAGWYLNGEKIESTTIVKTTSSHELVASWDANEYTVTYNSNGGITTPNSNPVTYDNEYGTLPEVERIGYTFNGWYLNGEKIENTTIVETPSNHELVASWKANKYTVTYNSNGATTTPSSNEVTYDSLYGTLPEIEKIGYTFAGWYLNGEKIENTTIVETSSNHELVASWTANKYIVTYNSNGATTTPNSNLVTYDNEYGTLPEVERIGYTFNGWYVNGVKIENTTIVATATNHELVANWEANKYTVTYNANGATTTPSSSKVTYNEAYGTLPIVERDGYTFAGWYLNGVKIESTTIVITSSSHELVANWTARKYTVSYNANGGTVNVQTNIVTFEENYGTLPIPEKEGYTFSGWYLNGTKIESTTKVITATSHELVANWNANEYTVTYNANGGSVTPSSNKVTYGSMYGTLPEIERTGYTFDGWYLNGVKIENTTIVDTASNHELVANWSANTYTIEFNSNGGTGTITNMPMTYDESKQLTTNTFTKTGYTFAGWNTKKDGTGTDYANGQTVNNLVSTNNGSIVLYAMWSANTYTIRFDSNGGTGSIDNLSIRYDESKRLIENTFTRTGYTFLGWHTNKNAVTPLYTDQEQVSNLTTVDNSSVIFYAIWQENIYTIEFNANNGIGSMASILTSYNRQTPLTANLFTKEGYTFVEWNTKDDGTGVSFSNLETVVNLVSEDNGKITLYAIWQINSYKVIFETSGGTTIDDVTGNYGTKINRPSTNPTKVGHTFVDWYSDSNFNTKFDFDTFTIPSCDVTIYAKWNVNASTIGFDTMGGSPVEAITKNYGETVTEPNAPTKVGYEFSGWYSDRQLTNRYTFTTMPANGIIVYAKWIANEYTVTYNSNGGTTTPNSNLVTYDSTYGTLPIVEKDGYTFVGWYLNGVKVESTTIVTTASNHELVASWETNKYTVTYNANGADTTPSSNKVTYDSNYGTLPTVDRVGYTFAGWYLNGVKVESTTIVTTTSNHELVASWDANEYTVTYNAIGATTVPSSNKVTYDSNYGTLPIVEKDGYTFAGWYLNGVKIENTTIVTTTSNHELVASWDANEYTVTYNANGGSVTPSSKKVTYDSNYGTLPLPTNIGYTFNGWYLNDEKIESATIVTTASNHVLVANWSANTYTIEFNSNGGTGTITDMSMTYDESKPLTTNSFTKTGYTFTGWNTKKDGTGIDYVNGQTVNNLVSTNNGSIVLYAMWSANTYTIRFDSNGGIGSMSSVLTGYDVNTILPKNTFSKVGYSFLGWSKTSNGMVDYNDEANATNISTYEDVTLFAIWQANKYTVTYNSNGATTTPNSNEVIYDSEYKTLPTVEKVGYTFSGWYLNGEKIESTTPVTTASNHELVARWTANKYTVTYNANGGEINSIGKEVTYNELYGELEEPTKVGHTFSGWYLNGAKIESTTIVTTSSNHELVAKWSANKYTVTYNSNGAATTPSSNKVTYGSNYGTLPTVEKVGYTFSGWYLNGKKIENATMVTTAGNHELVASWEANKYTVTYNANGGNPIPNSNEVTYNSEYGTLPTIERVGYTFSGWYLNGVKTENTTIVATANNHELIAKWTANSYTIEFNSNGGSGTIATIITAYDKATTLTTNTFTKEGYTFVNWNTNIDGSGTSYTNGQTISNLVTENNGNIVLYAVWQANEYTVSYDANGGKTKPSSNGVTYNGLYGALPIVERVGYTFAGWYLNGIKIESTTTVTTANNHELVARWTANKYTVTYNANGGDINSTGKEVTYNELYGELEEPTKVGYTFSGWYLNDTRIESTTTVTTASNHELVARWNANEYTVTYNSNGASTTPNSNKVTYNSKYGTLPTVEKVGYTFSGWYLNGVKIESTTTVNTASNHELVASWDANNYTVTYNANGGEISSTGKEVTYNELYGELDEPTKVGHTFVGWYLNGNKIESTTTVTTSSNHELVARWTANEYTVTYNANGASTTPSSNKVTYNSNYGTLPTVEKAGYTFSGWYLNDAKIDSTTIVSTAHNHELVARWNANEYTVTYNSNGADTTPSSNKVTYGSNYGTLPTVEKAGYTFAGWYLNGVKIESTTMVTASSNHELVARWNANKYTVTYNVNGGEISSTGKEVTYNELYGELDEPTKVGHTFVGWYLNGTKIERTTTVVTASNHELVARWTAKEYTVTYNSNGAITTPSSNKVTYNSNYGTLPIVEKTGYTFSGWYLNGVKIESTTIVTMTSNHELVASWDANKYTVTYNANGGSVTPSSSKVTYGSNYGTLPVPTKTGYTFVEWHLNDKEIENETVVATASNHELVAKWQANTYSIEFNSNGGSGSMATILTSYDKETTLTANTFIKDGHTFASWNTKQDGSGTTYSNLASVSKLVSENNGKITLYAQWVGNSYKINFNANGGTGTIDSLTMKYGETKALTQNTFIKEGYTFVNWNTEANGSGTTYTNGQQVSNLIATGEITLYAQWKINSYTIKFDANGGSGATVSSINTTYGKLETLPSSNYTKAGFAFVGWSTDKNATKETYTVGQQVSNLTKENNVTVTLYAVWIELPKIESISFDIYKKGLGKENYYDDGRDTSYVGDDTFYLKMPNDATLNLNTLGVQMSKSITLSTKNQDKTGDTVIDIYATKSNGNSGTITIPLNIAGIESDINVSTTDGMNWKSTSNSSSGTVDVSLFLDVTGGNSLAVVEGLGITNDEYKLETPRYVSYKVTVENNTFFFIYPKYKTDRKTVTFVNSTNNNAKITSVSVPTGSQTPDVEGLYAPGYTFEKWCVDAECTSEYDFTTKVYSNITVYGKYTKLDMDDRWYTNTTNDGSSAKPYEVCTVSELKALASLSNASTNYFSGKTIKLNCDVDMSGVAWADYSFDFKGTFDGNYHTISNLSVSHNSNIDSGFFKVLTNATVKNIIFTNANINTPSSEAGSGVVAGEAKNSTINRISVQNSNVKALQFAAGIVGSTATGTTITECEVLGGTIEASEHDAGSVTGIAGGKVTLKDLYSSATVKTSSLASDAGGIIGNYASSTNGLTMSNVIFTGEVSTGWFGGNPRGEIYGRLGTGAKDTSNWLNIKYDDSYSSSFDKSTWLFDSSTSSLGQNKGTGQNTTWLKTPSNFDTTVWSNWSFTSGSYPRLKWLVDIGK